MRALDLPHDDRRDARGERRDQPHARRVPAALRRRHHRGPAVDGHGAADPAAAGREPHRGDADGSPRRSRPRAGHLLRPPRLLPAHAAAARLHDRRAAAALLGGAAAVGPRSASGRGRRSTCRTTSIATRRCSRPRRRSPISSRRASARRRTPGISSIPTGRLRTPSSTEAPPARRATSRTFANGVPSPIGATDTSKPRPVSSACHSAAVRKANAGRQRPRQQRRDAVAEPHQTEAPAGGGVGLAHQQDRPGPHRRGDAGDQRTLRRAVDQVQHVEDRRHVDGLGQRAPRARRRSGSRPRRRARSEPDRRRGDAARCRAGAARPAAPATRPVASAPRARPRSPARARASSSPGPQPDVDQHARRRQPAGRQHRAVDGIAAQLGAREFPGRQRRAEIAIRRGRREPREAGIAIAPAQRGVGQQRRRRARRRCSGPCRRAADRARSATGPSTRTRPWTARRSRRGAATSPAGPRRRGRRA